MRGQRGHPVRLAWHEGQAVARADQEARALEGLRVFPAHEGFVIRIDSEEMLVTAVNSNTLTVTREASGRLAMDFPARPPAAI